MIKRILFKTTHENSFINEGAVTLLRFSVGILLAGLHGSGKIPPNERFIEGVTALGFPAPVIFAWLAAIAELIGGIFLAVGFLNRTSAFFIAITMFVAAFGRNIHDPWGVKELSIIYLVIAIFFAIRGAGRWSVDNLIKR